MCDERVKLESHEICGASDRGTTRSPEPLRSSSRIKVFYVTPMGQDSRRHVSSTTTRDKDCNVALRAHRSAQRLASLEAGPRGHLRQASDDLLLDAARRGR